ncbi:hypothetical protein [Bradyrhizobium sp. 33ap4]|uniref:hypothetical protein n=1 Tax=Bradyrhizobium sp. 33ap4 TaxID=3061630 RepID=UPI00292D4850|nr:hypothetical protein [Bradyrhizobium sp. 33ap4]
MPTPALNIPIKVVGLDGFKKNMNEMNVTAANAARAVTAQTIKMSAGFLASQGAAGAATLAFGKMLSVLRPVALGVTAVVDTFEFLKKSIELAGQEIEAFGNIAAKASSSGVSTDFWQRFTKSAPSAIMSIDQVTEALQRFSQASTDRLGGSELQQRIDELVKAGNFAGNTGVGAFAGASNTEQRLRAIVSLIDQAMQKGQQMAALDIAGKAFGEPVRAALQADNNYLDQVLRKTDAMSKAEIVSQDDIGRVIQLRDRMNEAQQILADKWKPVQRDMAELGLNARANWASVVTTFAQLVGLADRLYAMVKEIPNAFAAMGNASIWKKLTDLSDRLGLNSVPEGLETGVNVQRLDATNRLGAAMLNPANTRRAMQETSTVADAVRGDTSKMPGVKTATDDTDAVDRAISSLQRHIEVTKADTAAVGLGDAALARFRAQAAETAAVQANGGKETAEQAAQFAKLKEQVGAAADALAKARIGNDVRRGRQTALFDPRDVEIAERLKSIYPNVADALNSVEAAGMRTNEALREISNTVSNSLTTGLADLIDGTKSAGDAFASMAKSIIRSIEEVVIKQAIVAPLLRGFGLGGGGSLIPAFADGGIAPGGLALVGERGPELVSLPKGSKVIPNHVSAQMARDLASATGAGSGGGMVNNTAITMAPAVTVNVNGSAGGKSQNEDLARQVHAAVTDAAQRMVAREMRTQMKPGGLLKR